MIPFWGSALCVWRVGLRAATGRCCLQQPFCLTGGSHQAGLTSFPFQLPMLSDLGSPSGANLFVESLPRVSWATGCNMHLPHHGLWSELLFSPHCSVHNTSQCSVPLQPDTALLYCSRHSTPSSAGQQQPDCTSKHLSSQSHSLSSALSAQCHVMTEPAVVLQPSHKAAPSSLHPCPVASPPPTTKAHHPAPQQCAPGSAPGVRAPSSAAAPAPSAPARSAHARRRQRRRRSAAC